MAKWLRNHFTFSNLRILGGGKSYTLTLPRPTSTHLPPLSSLHLSPSTILLCPLLGAALLFVSCDKEPLTGAAAPGATRSLEPSDTTGTPSLGMTITVNPEWDGEQSYNY